MPAAIGGEPELTDGFATPYRILELATLFGSSNSHPLSDPLTRLCGLFVYLSGKYAKSPHLFIILHGVRIPTLMRSRVIYSQIVQLPTTALEVRR